MKDMVVKLMLVAMKDWQLLVVLVVVAKASWLTIVALMAFGFDFEQVPKSSLIGNDPYFCLQ